MRAVRTQRDGHLPFGDELRFETLEEGHPQTAFARSVAPVSVDRTARTLPLAHDEEATALAAAGVLRRVVQRKVAFESFAVCLDEVDSVLVRPPAVTPLPVPLDPLHRPRRVGIACIPHA